MQSAVEAEVDTVRLGRARVVTGFIRGTMTCAVPGDFL